MPSLTSIVASVACLVAITNAVPTKVASRQPYTDCEAGTSYYKCGANDGCFAQDPCVSASTPSESATPAAPSASCSSDGKASIIIPAAIYDIFPLNASLSVQAATGAHLETYKNASQVEQVVAFTGIPADAKECHFGWAQGEQIQRTFVIKGANGLAGVNQLTGFPADGTAITYDAITPFDADSTFIGSIDFTNWDDLGAASHTSGGVTCAETLYFKVALKDPNGLTKLYLKQDEVNGYQITYTC